MQGLLRLQDNTPTAYTEDSRDFQLMLRLLDCVNNGVGFYIDSITNTVDTKSCSASLLELLKTKIGFFSNVEFQERELRYILRGFPYIMKYKGSLRGIQEAVYMYMNAKGISCPHKVYTDKSEHKIVIYIESDVSDVTILDEVFKFIVPAGYQVEYIFYQPTTEQSEYVYRLSGNLLNASDSANSVLRGSTQGTIGGSSVYADAFNEEFIPQVLGSVGTANVIGSENTTNVSISLRDLESGDLVYNYQQPTEDE